METDICVTNMSNGSNDQLMKEWEGNMCDITGSEKKRCRNEGEEHVDVKNNSHANNNINNTGGLSLIQTYQLDKIYRCETFVQARKIETI